MLTKLKLFLKEQKIDFFLLPNSDEFFSEYLPENEKRIQYLTGFTGSSATVIFGQGKSYFFTDGRYTLQARQELDLEEFEIFNIAEKSVLAWLEDNWGNGKKLALDPKLMSLNFKKSLLVILGRTSARGSQEMDAKLTRSSGAHAPKDDGVGNDSAELLFLENNPVDKIWKDRPSPKNSAIFFCNKNLSGTASTTKRQQILKTLEADALIITKPENICWLLNIRAADVDFTPLLLAYAILFKNGEVELFVDQKRLAGIAESDLPKVHPIQSNCFDLRIGVLRKSFNKIQIEANTTNYWLYDLLEKNNFEIISKNDGAEIAKACKNEVEIKSAIKSHEVDGIAVTKFLFWLTESLKNGEEIDEIKAEEKLLEFRENHPDFLYPSFNSISGFSSNGAVIHYHANQKTNKKLKGDSLYLIDSGGQYFGQDFCGTTDITRTIAIGKPSAEMIENFTRVLKGHIALARAKFPLGTSGAQLDVLARSHLWQVGKDYDHGTGHGVGNFLSVHEGPCGISKRAHQPLLTGMILSNEPGFYKEGGYGIRIENLMLVEKFDEKFLQFRTLTLAPFDPSLIDFQMLTRPEKKWLWNYHNEILEKVGSEVGIEVREWLRTILQSFI